MKKFKLLSILLGCVMLTSSFVACGGNTEEFDSTKTQLFVAVTEGGAGQEYMTRYKTAFEQKYANVSFEDGKMGVELIPEWGKEEYTNSTVSADLKSGSKNYDVYIIGGNDYEDFVANDLWLDITDIVKAKADPSEDKTIEEKMNSELIPFYSNSYLADGNAKKGKYYALPHTQAILGLNYDIDLFDKENYYFYENGFMGSGTKAVGPDGIANTSDDGLPATYAQFKELVDEIRLKYIPFTWTSLQGYLEEFIIAVMAAEMGHDEFRQSFEFNGVITQEDGTKVTITEQNGYELIKQKGRKYGIEVAYDFGTQPWSSSKAFDTNQTHIKAQQEYVWSPKVGSKQIAMIIEGSWWENEAKSTGAFDSMVNDHGSEYAFGTRRYGYMPFPKENGSTADNLGNTLLSSSDKSVFAINAATSKPDLAKKFLQFCFSNEMLADYTATTGILRPYDYKLSDAQYNGLSSYAQSVYDTIKEPANKVANLNITTNKMRRTENSYLVYLSRTRSKMAGLTYDNPIGDFHRYPNFTVEDYYNGVLSVYTVDDWTTKLGSYWS